MIRTIIADDHQLFIDGIRSLLELDRKIEIVYEALTGTQVIDFLKKDKADIVLMDINMPEMDGIEASKTIKEKFPDVKILVLTMHGEMSFIEQLMEIGVDGYIIKNASKNELSKAVQQLVSGNTYFDKRVTNTIVSNYTRSKPKEKEAIHITKRELEVLCLLADEFTTQEVADQLFVSTHTVETHRSNLLSKIGVRKTIGLVRYAVENNLCNKKE